MTEAIPLFAAARPGDVELDLALPPSWAQTYERARVVFEHLEHWGWHAALESPDGDRLVGFEVQHDVDKMLRGEVPSALPEPTLPDGRWHDLDQGWWVAIRRVGDAVFIAETDFDGLVDVPGTPVVRLIRPGRVDVSGIEVTWSRVSRAVWLEAWEVARASCVAGAPAPSRPRCAPDGERPTRGDQA